MSSGWLILILLSLVTALLALFIEIRISDKEHKKLKKKVADAILAHDCEVERIYRRIRESEDHIAELESKKEDRDNVHR